MLRGGVVDGCVVGLAGGVCGGSVIGGKGGPLGWRALVVCCGCSGDGGLVGKQRYATPLLPWSYLTYLPRCPSPTLKIKLTDAWAPSFCVLSGLVRKQKLVGGKRKSKKI